MTKFTKRLSAALDDPLSPDRANPHPSIGPDAEGTFWITENGVIWLSFDERNTFKVESERVWPPLDNETGRKALENFLRDLGIPSSVGFSIQYHVRIDEGPGARRADYRVYQSYDGRTLFPPIMEGWIADRAGVVGGPDSRFVSEFELRRIHDLSKAQLEITQEKAEELALEFFECVRGVDGRVDAQDPGYGVAFDSFAFGVMVIRDGEGCSSTGEEVLVDAKTGAILGFSGSGMSVAC